jgi:hypothetical protein
VGWGEVWPPTDESVGWLRYTAKAMFEFGLGPDKDDGLLYVGVQTFGNGAIVADLL